MNLANIHYERDEIVEAEALYEKAIRLDVRVLRGVLQPRQHPPRCGAIPGGGRRLPRRARHQSRLSRSALLSGGDAREARPLRRGPPALARVPRRSRPTASSSSWRKSFRTRPTFMSVSVRAFDVLRVSARDSGADRDRVAVETAARSPAEQRAVLRDHADAGRRPSPRARVSAERERHPAASTRSSASISTRSRTSSTSGSRRIASTEVLGQRRQVAMNSSCGMCGRRSLESLSIDAKPFVSTGR